jgi:ABC-type bacteriocin/lantibiotic exporter with double-glycine peptidase domain
MEKEMKEFEIIPESKNEGWCGVSSLCFVAKRLSVPYYPNELARTMKTTEKEGTSHINMLLGARSLGLYARQVSDIPIEALIVIKKSRRYQIIVNWMDGKNYEEDGHYSILEDIDNKLTVLQDSTWGEIRAMRNETFDKLWFDFENGKRINRWALFLKKVHHQPK